MTVFWFFWYFFRLACNTTGFGVLSERAPRLDWAGLDWVVGVGRDWIGLVLDRMARMARKRQRGFLGLLGCVFFWISFWDCKRVLWVYAFWTSTLDVYHGKWKWKWNGIGFTPKIALGQRLNGKNVFFFSRKFN